MKEHMIVAHNKEKHICSICKVEKPSLNRLKHHMNINHIRIPCEHCGKLLGKAMMKRHIRDCHRCEIFGFFSPLVPSKREKNVLVLLSLYIF